MDKFDMNSDFVGPAQAWCPYCQEYYPFGTEHKCANQPISKKLEYTAEGGYVCPNCDQWVEYGSFHYCSKAPYGFSSGFKFELVLSPTLENKLDKLISLLEDLVLHITGDLK